MIHIFIKIPIININFIRPVLIVGRKPKTENRFFSFQEATSL